MANTDSLRSDLAVPQRQESALDRIVRQIQSEQMQSQIARALPSLVSADHYVRTVITAVRQNPKLAECDPTSLWGAVFLSAQLGLEPGPLGYVYFIPRKGQVQWLLGYKGMIALARRTGILQTIYSRPVFEADDFEYAYGIEDTVLHRPKAVEPDPDKLTHVYAVAKYFAPDGHSDGGYNLEVLTRPMLDARRARSASEQAGRNSPWKTDPIPMYRKTGIRALEPVLPMTAEAADAVARDEMVQRWDADEGVVEVDSVVTEQLEAEGGDE